MNKNSVRTQPQIRIIYNPRWLRTQTQLNRREIGNYVNVWTLA